MVDYGSAVSNVRQDKAALNANSKKSQGSRSALMSHYAIGSERSLKT